MNFGFSAYAVPLLLAAGASLVFAWYALRRRQQAEARTFGILMLALFWWSMCYALHICATDLQTQYLLNRLKYIGVVAVPPLWLILALQYTGQASMFSRRNLALLFIPAIVFLPIVLSDPLTHLWWPSIWQEGFNGHLVMRSTHGIPYYAHTIISYGYVVAGLWLYVRFYLRAKPPYRAQARIMIIAVLIPLAANIITQIGFSPLPWGLDSFFFTLGSVFMAVAIFRYQFLDMVPVARQAVVEQIPQGVIVIDQSGRIVDTNPAALALLGTGNEQIMGQTLDSAIQLTALRTALLDLTQQEPNQPGQLDVQLDSQTGSLTLSLNVSPLLHEATDGPIGQIILLSDITDRVAAQSRLESLYQQAEIERERLALTIQTASDAIVLLDDQGHVLASNPTAHRFLQAEESEQFPLQVRDLIEKALASPGVTEAEIEIGEQNFHVAAAPVAGTGLVLTMHDITQFEQLARLKDKFVRTVSHDLRTPLTSIRGYAQLAMLARTPEHKRQDALKRIEMSASRMSKLTTDLLDLATLEAGAAFESKEIQLDELARVSMEDLEGAALTKGLSIHYDLDGLPAIQADPRLITQVWRNLIDNAIKYTEAGSITIRTKALDNRVMGQITDTGVGIIPAAQPYIFDKFFRAPGPLTHKVSGAGLGLSLVKSIVENYGGRVQVESEIEKGSTFTFTLPINQEL